MKTTIQAMLTIVAVCLWSATASVGQAALLYDQGFEADTAGWIGNGGTVTRVASGSGGIASSSGSFHAVLESANDTKDGAYTFGDPPPDPPHGNQWYLAPGFGTFAQSIDIYIDPAMGSVGDQWDIEVTLDHANGDAAYGEYNFKASKTIDGYFIGGEDTTLEEVTTAGWYTFASAFSEGAGVLDTSFTISGPGYYRDLGGMSGAAKPLDAGGAAAGYMWIFGRNSTTLDLAIDNVQYVAVPEPASLVLLVSAVLGAMLLTRARAT